MQALYAIKLPTLGHDKGALYCSRSESDQYYIYLYRIIFFICCSYINDKMENYYYCSKYLSVEMPRGETGVLFLFLVGTWAL
jgi:hypothetical protein